MVSARIVYSPFDVLFAMLLSLLRFPLPMPSYALLLSPVTTIDEEEGDDEEDDDEEDDELDEEDLRS